MAPLVDAPGFLSFGQDSHSSYSNFPSLMSIHNFDTEFWQFSVARLIGESVKRVPLGAKGHQELQQSWGVPSAPWVPVGPEVTARLPIPYRVEKVRSYFRTGAVKAVVRQIPFPYQAGRGMYCS